MGFGFFFDGMQVGIQTRRQVGITLHRKPRSVNRTGAWACNHTRNPKPETRNPKPETRKVFGRVIEGIDSVMELGRCKTGSNDRPAQQVLNPNP
jgi:hypothetical protein